MSDDDFEHLYTLRAVEPEPVDETACVCNGGPHARKWCGQRATVVVSEKNGGAHPLQWFACDQVEHHEGGEAKPIAQWFARCGLPVPGEPRS